MIERLVDLETDGHVLSVEACDVRRSAKLREYPYSGGKREYQYREKGLLNKGKPFFVANQGAGEYAHRFPHTYFSTRYLQTT